MSLDNVLGNGSHSSSFIYSAPINTECSKCSGKCLNVEDNLATQSAAREMFGYIPNRCVADQNGTLRCPFASGSQNKTLKNVQIGL